MRTSRRDFGKLILSGVGLAAVATGLPAAFLKNPLAFAAEGEDSCTAGNSRFLILSMSDSGDPFNANVPGAYEAEGIIHPPGEDFAATALTLGGVSTRAARIWSTLPQWALDRASFVHHSTRTVVHPDMPKVLRLMGGTSDGDMLPSMLAQQLAPCLGTIQAAPVSVGRVPLTAHGAPLPNLRPNALKQLLVRQNNALTNLRTIRDKHLDEIHGILKTQGTTEQRRFLDARAQSRTDTRKLADDAATLFSAINNDGPDNQILAAVGLIRLGVTPVVAVTLPFGGDNHTDEGLTTESRQYIEGVGAIARLMTLLQENGLEDRVTFATMNVFGRTLARKALTGRDHWPRHAVSLMIGKGVRPGVIGGMAALDDDFTALGIDSGSGRGVDGGGDVPYEETLSSVGKTLGAALGVPRAALDEAIRGGKVIDAAVA